MGNISADGKGGNKELSVHAGEMAMLCLFAFLHEKVLGLIPVFFQRDHWHQGDAQGTCQRASFCWEFLKCPQILSTNKQDTKWLHWAHAHFLQLCPAHFLLVETVQITGGPQQGTCSLVGVFRQLGVALPKGQLFLETFSENYGRGALKRHLWACSSSLRPATAAAALLPFPPQRRPGVGLSSQGCSNQNSVLLTICFSFLWSIGIRKQVLKASLFLPFQRQTMSLKSSRFCFNVFIIILFSVLFCTQKKVVKGERPYPEGMSNTTDSLWRSFLKRPLR